MVNEEVRFFNPNDLKFRVGWFNQHNLCFTEKTLVAVLMDLFQAGAETTSTTLVWLLLYMTVFPEIQYKLQAEIDEIIGKKKPSTEHRPR